MNDKKVIYPLIALFYLAVAGISTLIAYLFLDNANPFAPWNIAWYEGVAAAIGLTAIVILFDRISERLFIWAREINQFFLATLGKLTLKEALFIAIFSSFGEEILFRGLLLPSIGIIPSSLIFGLMHWGGRQKSLWIWTLMATILGFALAALTLWSGNIVPAVVAHFLINFINLKRLGQDE